ncbi:MAG: hypothetical protein QXY62_01745 [Candidatus Altiarchaeota archaeon]
MTDAKELLKKAKESIFFLGLNDLSAVLSYENMLHGLGKMLYVAEQAYCVFGPDASITRNVDRWLSGFGYGCVIRWKPKGIYFPEIRPNGCGMILVKIEELANESIIEKISEFKKEQIELNGTKIEPDFGRGNHFIEFYSVSSVLPEIEDMISKDEYYAILHCSASERKHEIYSMVEQGNLVETPLGKISVLDGNLAKEYYRKWKKFDEFSRKRRELLAKELFPKCKVISNLTHQGIFSENEIRLGCNDSLDKHYGKGKALFPIALRWDLPLYIFQGKKNLSDRVINMLNFRERAKNLGILDELKNINILPHGGGYSISLPYTEVKMVKTEILNNFILSNKNFRNKIQYRSRDLFSYERMILTTPHDLPYNYRGIEVIEKTLEYDLATPAAVLKPIMTFKV